MAIKARKTYYLHQPNKKLSRSAYISDFVELVGGELPLYMGKNVIWLRKGYDLYFVRRIAG